MKLFPGVNSMGMVRDPRLTRQLTVLKFVNSLLDIVENLMDVPVWIAHRDFYPGPGPDGRGKTQILI